MGKAKNGEDMRTWGKLVDQDSKDIFPLKGETVVVGRQAAHCGIVLTKPYVSGKHFSLKRVGKDGGEVLLTDLSSNGTFRGDSVEHMVAGKLPVKGSDKLLHLDFVGIGCQTQDFLTLQVCLRSAGNGASYSSSETNDEEDSDEDEGGFMAPMTARRLPDPHPGGRPAA
ncbi:hypothetical protein T484DRAFT_1759771 [Baffinella frigidus]|nr:hypothetical protein T484DRAFT_1759771 [Cryptophyta sp. CCMP2293]